MTRTLGFLALVAFGCDAAVSSDHAAPVDAPIPRMAVGGTAESDSGPVRVRHLANEGVLLAADSAAVVIDGLFGEGLPDYPAVPAATRDSLERALGAYGAIRAVLVTHPHDDHFDPRGVAAHLGANPETIFVGHPEAADAMREGIEGFEAIADRVLAPAIAYGEEVRIVAGGVAVRVLGVPHDGGPDRIGHRAYVVELAGRRFVHTGDGPSAPGDLAPFDLPSAGIDVAFVPFWILYDETGRRIVTDEIASERVVAIHLSHDGAAREARRVRAAMPTAEVFGAP